MTGYVITALPGGKSVRTAAVTRFLVGGLANGRAYRFTVRAVNRRGAGQASRRSAAVRPRAPGRPSPPRSVRVTPGFQQVTVSWSPPSRDGGDGLSGYRLTTSPKAKTVTVAATATRATLTGLADGRAYRVSVTARTSAGTSKAAVSAAVRPHVTAPAAPGSVTAAPAATGVTISWTAPPSDGGSPVSGYVITGNGTRFTAPATATSRTVTKSLIAGKSYTFRVAARNAKGTGPATAAAPATAGATRAARTVVLSAASLAALTSVSTAGTMTFAHPPAQVTGLAAGDIVVAGVSAATPDGLLAKVTSVTRNGSAATVATTPASLDEALTHAAFGAAGTLARGQVTSFTPARKGVQLLPASAVSPAATLGTLSLSLNTDLYRAKNGREVKVDGTISLTPAISFAASVSCCFHTASSFRGTVTAAASLAIHADESHTISGGYTLGTFRFRLVFDVDGVPVVIVPKLTVRLIAKGSVTAGLSAGAGASVTVGARVTTKNAHVSAKPIFSHQVSYDSPRLYGTMSAAAGGGGGPVGVGRRDRRPGPDRRPVAREAVRFPHREPMVDAERGERDRP